MRIDTYYNTYLTLLANVLIYARLYCSESNAFRFIVISAIQDKD